MTTKRIDDMEKEIAALKSRVNLLLALGIVSFVMTLVKCFINFPTQYMPPAPTNTNSVQIGNASEKKPQREFLNSDEVGEREGVSSRTVTSWIEQGRIYPQPTRQGRAWVIAADYRLLPQNTELTETKP